MRDEDFPDKCARCGSLPYDADSFYCTKCGLSLRNFCSNPKCELRLELNAVQLDADSCYCHCCGSESTYLKEGVLHPYKA